MVSGDSEGAIKKVDFVKNRLIELYKRNIVKINHSVMELVCARHLIRYGYSVDVEKRLTDILVCDVYATKGDGEAVVEIETGFVPPEHALDPLSYYTARITSKIARYRKFANQFVLATTPASILSLPYIFRRPPRDRKYNELQQLKLLCDKYYDNPPISVDEILNGRVHMIYIINIDEAKVIEMDVDSYLELNNNMISISNAYVGPP